MATAPSCSDGKNIDVNRKKNGNLSRSRLYANRWVEIGPETTTKTSSHKITGIWFKRKQEIKKPVRWIRDDVMEAGVKARKKERKKKICHVHILIYF